MSNYTKGEWEAKKATTLESKEIYAIRTYPEPTRIQRVADVFEEANAQLIASAPDLYEALKDLYDMYQPEYDEFPPEPWNKAIKALAKIEK